MLIVIILLIAVVSLLSLAAIIAFSGSKINTSIAGEGKEILPATEITKTVSSSINSVGEKFEKNYSAEGEYLPVLDIDVPVKDFKNEIVHYRGRGKFFQIESESQVSDIKPEEHLIDESGKISSPIIEGDIYLTGRWIVVVGKEIKKIPLKSIEDFVFKNEYLILKRKRVKKKKDIFEILNDRANFYYILKVLVK